MKKSLKILLCLTVFSHTAYCLSFGLGMRLPILGARRNWQEALSRAAEPEIIEVVRWRQPVCVVPGKDVPPCLTSLRKFQNDYELNSAAGNEAANSKKIGKKRSDVLSPQIVDKFKVENVDSVKLDSSEETGRSFDQSFTLNLRSATPEIENASSDRRQGKYLVMSSFGKATTVVHDTPPAIYVTKVLNSPVTATLVANNCFPDIGVPLCDSYQETITIYKDSAATYFNEKIDTPENTDQVTEVSVTTDNNVQENNETTDFWNDPNNPNFDDGTAQNQPQRPTGLLGQAIQHVISKPGVISAIPPGVIDAIANNPGILEALANADSNGQSSSAGSTVTTVTETIIKPQIVTNMESSQDIEVSSSTSKPSLIGSLLDIQRPTILNNFFNNGFNIFNRSTTSKPPVTVHDDVEETSSESSQSSADVPIGGGLLGQGIGQAPVIQSIQNFIHRPETVNTNEKPEFKPVLVVEPTQKPGLFETLWNPGNFGIFNIISSTTAASKPNDEAINQNGSENEETKSVYPPLVEVPERPKLSEILFKPENDISGRPTLPNIFNSAKAGSENYEAKPTQSPGLFGGLFKNPARPNTVDESVENTKTILGMGSSIFAKPTNKPLIIERPGAKPLLVEKPIYVQEKPVQSAGLLNFFIPASNEPILTVDHEVIKDPVYVYQKPQTSSGILSNVFGNGVNLSGFFQGWAIFGNSGDKQSEQNKLHDETEKVSQTGQNLRATVVKPVTSTVDEIAAPETPETVAIETTPLESSVGIPSDSEQEESAIDEEAIAAIVEALEEEEIEEASTAVVDVNDTESEVVPKLLLPEETSSTVDAIHVENIVAAVPLDSPAKSAAILEDIPEDIASEVNAELAGPIDVFQTALKTIADKPAVESSVDPSESPITGSSFAESVDSIAVRKIVEEPALNLVTDSQNIVNEPENPEEDSAIKLA